MLQTMAIPCFATAVAFASAARRPSQKEKKKRVDTTQPGSAKVGFSSEKTQNGSAKVGFGSEKKQLSWKCVERCGACCKLDKGPAFASPEEIFENPEEVEYYKSLIGPDGWCIHYEKSTHKCSIYSDRPYFCRVTPEVFESLYGIDEKKFNREACSCCTDTIKAIYGTNSEELNRFNRAIRSSDSV